MTKRNILHGRGRTGSKQSRSKQIKADQQAKCIRAFVKERVSAVYAAGTLFQRYGKMLVTQRGSMAKGLF